MALLMIKRFMLMYHDMIYYLNEEPILKNVPTYQMENLEEREFVFADMGNMVIKETNGSGGTEW
jgi:uncharacterized circularly permuted ATP-grasp superfamily protein